MDFWSVVLFFLADEMYMLSYAFAYLIKQNIIYQDNDQRVTEMLEILHKYLISFLNVEHCCSSLFLRFYLNDTNTLPKLIVYYLKSDPEPTNLLGQK
jgi:hypothetical protein